MLCTKPVADAVLAVVLVTVFAGWAKAQDVSMGTQSFDVSGGERIAAIASINEVTRISAEGETFLSVIDSVGSQGAAVDYQILDATGDIFVSVSDGTSGQRVSAFAVTADSTYNINFTLKDVPAQQVNIRNSVLMSERAIEELRAREDNKPKKRSAARKVQFKHTGPYKQQMATLMRALYYRAEVAGFDREERKDISVLDGVTMQRTLSYTSPTLIGDVYRLYTTDGSVRVADNSLVEGMEPLVWSVTDPMISADTVSRLIVIKERGHE